MLISFFVVLLLTAVSACLYFYFIHAADPAEPLLSGALRQGGISVGDMRRNYLSYVPAGLRSGAPLLLVLHGRGIDSAKMRVFTGYQFERLAERHGFAVVYPDGYGKAWNDCRNDVSTQAKKENIDDVAFLRDLVEHLRRESGIDPARVYAMGYSNGGQMGFRLVAEHPDMLAGLAVAGANLPVPQERICEFLGLAPPLMLVSGTADKIIPYQGGEISLFGRRNIGSVVSSQDTAEFFAALADANSHEHVPAVSFADGTSVEVQTWKSDARHAVTLYTIHGGGHVVPQTTYRFPRLLGKTTRGFDMPAACINFFGL